MCVPARNVCVCYGLWNPPTASLPNCISAPGVASWGKHSVFHFIHCHVRSFLLVSLIWHPAHASSLRRRGWWKKPSPIFWIWTAIPSSIAVSILHTAPLNVLLKNSTEVIPHLIGQHNHFQVIIIRRINVSWAPNQQKEMLFWIVTIAYFTICFYLYFWSK